LADVYTTRFLNAGAVAFAEFTAPAGYRCVLRDINMLFNGALTADGWSFAIAGKLLAAGQVPSSAVFMWRWQGRQVIEAGEELTFGASNPNFYVMATGYQLFLP
jgi:hypothetical protein